MASSSAHVDKRYLYLRGLFTRSSNSAVANYKEKEWLHLCKVLARISLATEPLPNRSAVIQTIKGCGSTVEELLKEILSLIHI